MTRHWNSLSDRLAPSTSCNSTTLNTMRSRSDVFIVGRPTSVKREKGIITFSLDFYHRWIAEDLEEGASATPRPTGFREEEALDLRDARVSVHLRGDDLDLKGAQCYFWVHSGGTRWHYTGRPLKIHHGEWGPPEHFVLVNDESLWHRSWAPSRASLDALLKKSASYGFSFVGFSEEVTGQALHGPLRDPPGESVAETFAFQEDSDPNGHRMQ